MSPAARDAPPFSLAEARDFLARMPLLLDVWLSGLSDEWLYANEGGESWSPYDVLGHLIHGEKSDWIPRLRRLLEDGTSVPFDKFDRFAQFRDSAGKSVAELLAEFAERRAASLAAFDELGLDDTELDRRGLHPELGEVTARELLACWVAHDLDHVMQIARVLAHRHRDEVGPWRAYLRVISGQPG
jgi:uncharacterized damage-inducible protein DinB